LELGFVDHLDLHQPALVVGVLVHDARLVLDLRVDGDHRPADGGEQLGDRPHRLDLAEGLALLDLVPDAGHPDRDAPAELALPVVGEADMGAFALHPYPEMILGELQGVRHTKAPRAPARPVIGRRPPSSSLRRGADTARYRPGATSSRWWRRS